MINKGHLTYSDRLAIELMLNDGNKIGEIERDIKRTFSVISREIDKHITFVYPSIYNNNHPCLKWDNCKVKGYNCHINCKNIEYKLCPKLNKSPHVCNGCTSKSGCRYIKKYYRAESSHNSYKTTLKEIRTRLHYTNREMMVLVEILCPLIIQTKSVYHSVHTINLELKTSFKIKTLYWQIKKNYLPIKSSDLPRSRKKSVSKDKDKNYKRDIKNHTYEDYNVYRESNPNAIETQMDTVEGIKENNAPVLLTLEIVEINFLFIFKIDSKTKEDVIKKLSYFKDLIGEETFNALMEILLTDNGSEFFVVDDLLEIAPLVHLFYCHPYASYEKGSIENNHELIRRVIPKGVSLKPYTQKELNLLCSHINSLFRESLDGKCPFDLIEKFIPLEKINQLGLSKISPLNVKLIPELLGEKNINNIKKYLDKKEIKKANITFINSNE